jgi:hypothetical protein
MFIDLFAGCGKYTDKDSMERNMVDEMPFSYQVGKINGEYLKKFFATARC